MRLGDDAEIICSPPTTEELQYVFGILAARHPIHEQEAQGLAAQVEDHHHSGIHFHRLIVELVGSVAPGAHGVQS